MGITVKLLSVLATLALLGNGAHAAEAVQPLSVNDIRVLLEQGVNLLSEKVRDSKNLVASDRERIARDIEIEADKLRERLDQVAADATVMGGRTYPAGILLTYQGEMGFTSTAIPAIHYGPGAEAGLALFLKRNSYLSEAIRGTDAIVFSVGANAAGRRISGGARDRRGMELKVLFVNPSQSEGAATLEAFEGFYTGIGAQVGLFGGRDLGEIYTKPQACTSWINPLSCPVFIWRVGGMRAEESGGEIKQLFINFPHSNDKRGYSLF